MTTPPQRSTAPRRAITHVLLTVYALWLRLRGGTAPRQRLRGARGDVPGWVMVTLMSALLVAAIYAVAGPALVNMFTNAINKVGGLK